MDTNANTPSPNDYINTPTRLTGAEILWATLVGEGVTDVFGYPGGAILPAYDALRKFPIHHILVRHEQGAAHMADGYARASGKIGVCIATSGPGATNLVTGIATAMLDSIPIVAITAQVGSTLLGLGGVPTHHTLSLGLMGLHDESWVNDAIQQADPLLAFGMRFDDRVTGNLTQYAPNAKKIHIEIDPSEINKNVRAGVALIGDLKGVLELLLPLLPKNTDTSWLREINAMKGDAAVRDIINLPDNGHLYAAHVINDIWHEAQSAGRTEQTIIVTDVGQHQMWEAQYYKHDTPRSLITSGGLGTMGFALPAAIGAKVACPEKDVWVIAGDGGFQMTCSELSTIVQEKLAINIAVINNGFLGMVRQWQEAFYDKNYAASPILSPDFVALAAAHGIAGAHVRKREDVTATVTRSRTSGKPFLINFQVEKEDGVYPMIAP